MLGASSGGSSFFLLIIVVFAVIWFMVIRPQKKRQVEAARMLNTIEVGDEVLTAGGIYGEVVELQDDAIVVRIAPAIEVRVARKAIGAVVRPDEPEPAEPAAGQEPEAEVDPVAAPDPETGG